MEPDDSVRPPVEAGPDDDFAGELFLSLAEEGRLVVDAERADRMIRDLQYTLVLLGARLHLLRSWQTAPEPIDELAPELVDSVVDAAFADQLAPGHLERAVVELPKYLRALRLARREQTDPGQR